ncbi:BTB/POZ domain-containing protein Tiwaz [Bicyclus anynana]|uniref:BTB/POZ domain-containing protein Tiwaz n=1 Tax=Bicyclus anynana TaxID=110368 RepID=A0A6J1MVZ7_BICAN|nr:BTB/POZ domain-containing protein Tiwaz [Bicyclus anynana]
MDIDEHSLQNENEQEKGPYDLQWRPRSRRTYQQHNIGYRNQKIERMEQYSIADLPDITTYMIGKSTEADIRTKAGPAFNNRMTDRVKPVPKAATPAHDEAPVHIDVGGVIYTSSLRTLTKYPDSKLGMMFSGRIPIIVDNLKQHYFIDRDGLMFRHILNFLRNDTVLVPPDYKYLDLLLSEAEFFHLDDMISQLRVLKNLRVSKKLFT